MTEVAEAAVLCHYKKYAQVYTYPDGRQIPTVRSWMLDTIARCMNLGYRRTVTEMESTVEAAKPDSWPMHVGGEPCTGYLGRFQPWMRALVHRNLVDAGNTALKSVDWREGTRDKERPAFQFKISGVVNPTATQFPCLCKEAHAMSIATKILEGTMTKLAPLVSMLAAGMKNMDRATVHSRVWHKINGQMQLAMTKALQDITTDADVRHRCAKHQMAHVQPRMTEVITTHCESAARQERKAVQWKARELQISRFQQWLERLYLDDEDEEEVAGSAQEEQWAAGVYAAMEVDDSDDCSREQ